MSELNSFHQINKYSQIHTFLLQHTWVSPGISYMWTAEIFFIFRDVNFCPYQTNNNLRDCEVVTFSSSSFDHSYQDFFSQCVYKQRSWKKNFCFWKIGNFFITPHCFVRRMNANLKISTVCCKTNTYIFTITMCLLAPQKQLYFHKFAVLKKKLRACKNKVFHKFSGAIL